MATHIRNAFNTPIQWSLIKTLGIAACLTLYQLLLSLFINGGSWSRLTQWDVAWYRSVADLGYLVRFPLESMPDRASNIAFFPGFPIWMKGFMSFFGMSSLQAAPFSAHVAYCGFWVYFFLTLKRLGVSAAVAIFLAFFLVCQPGAFYFVTGYSESFFSFMIAGFIYWTMKTFEEQTPSLSSFLLAAVHGIGMTATRFVGFPLVIYPLIYAFLKSPRAKGSGRRLFLATLLSTLSLLGVLSFFLYSHLVFGKWNLHFEALRIGWVVSPGFGKFLTWSYYQSCLLGGDLADMIGKICTWVALFFSIRFAARAWRNPSMGAFPKSLTFFSLFFLLEMIFASHGVRSMVRYLLPFYVIFFPVIGREIQQILDDGRKMEILTPVKIVLVIALVLLLTALQAEFINRYAAATWVA